MTSRNELKNALRGDLEAIEQICLATWEPLYRFIYYKVQNREEAAIRTAQYRALQTLSKVLDSDY